MGSINILSTSYQFRPGQILVPNSERKLSHQVFLGFQNYIYSTFTSTTKRGLLWTCWHIKKSKILNFHRYRTIRVMRMNGQSWVFQHRRQKQGWRGVLTSAVGTRGQPCRRAASATREAQPLHAHMGGDHHMEPAPGEGSFLEVSVRAAHTGNPAALGGGPTQRR